MIKPGEQLALIGPERREAQPVSDEIIAAQPSHLKAIHLAVQVSGKDDKELYMPLGIDKATWSHIMSGRFAFPTNKYEQLYDLTNEIPLRWLAFKRGYKLERLLSDVEAENEALRQKIAEMENEMKIVRKWLKGVKA